MTEVIVVLVFGILLVWLSKESRKLNQSIDKLSPKEIKYLIFTVNKDHRKNLVVGCSVTKV